MINSINIPYSILLVAVASLLTIFLRAVPFLLFSGSRKMPPIVKKITADLPPAIMAVLVIYCIKDSFSSFNYTTLATLIAVVVVVLLHLLKKNMLLSIFGGTAVYMICIRVFPSFLP